MRCFAARMSLPCPSCARAPSRMTARHAPGAVMLLLITGLQACYTDFANKRIGGGFLVHGLVQEELLVMEFFDMARLQGARWPLTRDSLCCWPRRTSIGACSAPQLQCVTAQDRA